MSESLEKTSWDPLELPADELSEHEDEHGDERERDHRIEGDGGVVGDHCRDDHARHEDAVEELDESEADRLPDGVHVVGGSRHQVAGLVVLIELRRHLQQMAEKLVAELGLDVPRGADYEVAPEIAADGDHRRHADHPQRRLQHLRDGETAGCDDVDRGFRESGDHHLGSVDDEQADNADNVVELVFFKIRQHRSEFF